MPISSGAGGKVTAERLVVTSGGNRRIYWPNIVPIGSATRHSQAQPKGATERREATAINSGGQQASRQARQTSSTQQVGRNLGAPTASASSKTTSTFKAPGAPLANEPKACQGAATISAECDGRSCANALQQLKQIEDCQLSITSDSDEEVDREDARQAKQSAQMNKLGGQRIVLGAPSGPADLSGSNQQAVNNGKKHQLSKGRPILPTTTTTTTATNDKSLSLSSLISGANNSTSRLTISTGTGATIGQAPATGSSFQLISSANMLAAAAAAANGPSAHKQSITSLNPNFCSANSTSSSQQYLTANSTSSSTAHLNGTAQQQQFANSSSNARHLNINKRVNLKYVKTLIIALLAIDLLITVLVHQFAQQDTISLIFTSYKLRFSLLNLILSAAWFILLIGAILFDIYFILFISCLVNVASFVLLLVFSIIHFMHRIDYNSVNLTSLLLLLFSITILHVYLLVMSALTVYLMTAVKQRRRSITR